jgi:hypothetical protein
MKRAMWALLAGLAMAAGLAGSLFYTWMLDPVEYYDTAPDTLYIKDKLTYLALIGDLYVYDQDLAQARARLTELGIEPDGPTLAGLVERYLDGGGQPEQIRNLARLAQDLGASGGVLLVFGPIPTPSPTFAPPTAIIQPETSVTPLPSATPAPSFRLTEQTAVCADPGQFGKIIVWVQDKEGQELPGVQVVASWAAGEDRFFTGLRPERGPGYADLQMSPQVKYDVALADFRGEVAQGLAADLLPGTCPTDTIALNWHLTFQQSD